MLWARIASKFFVNGAPQWPVAVAASATVLAGVGGAVAVNHSASTVAGGPPATVERVTGGIAIPDAVSVPPATPTPAAPGQAPPSVPGGAAVSPVHKAVLASVRPAPVHAPSAPASHVNYLTSDDGTLNTRVGIYSDCSGNLPLATESAAISTCVTGRLYFVGHNYGVFTPLIHMGVGSGITYWDGFARAHHYRVVNVRTNWPASSGLPPVSQAGVAAQFQTCMIPDGSVDKIMDAVEDSPPAAAPAPTPVLASAPVSTTAPAPQPSPLTTVVQPVTTTTTSILSSPLLGILGHR